MISSDIDQSTTEYSVRLANYKNGFDGRAIIGLLDRYARLEEGGSKPLSTYTIKNLIPTLQEVDGSVSVIALDGGRPIGLINAFKGFSTFQCKHLLNIHDVIVHEEYRRNGIAKKMFALLQYYAEEQGYCKLTLEVLNNNTSAKSLYRSLGFDAYELIPRMGKALFWQKIL